MNDEGYEAHSLTGVGISSFQNVHARKWYSLRGFLDYEGARAFVFKRRFIELIEETNNPEEREKYWIEIYGSFKNGYNATIGGDGKPYLDYDVLEEEYKQLQNLNEVSRKYGCDPQNLSEILKIRGCKIFSNQEVNLQYYGKIVNQYDKTGKFLKTFPSAKSAAREVCPKTTSLGGVTSHITSVCKGKRKTAYGYIWRFAN